MQVSTGSPFGARTTTKPPPRTLVTKASCLGSCAEGCRMLLGSALRPRAKPATSVTATRSYAVKNTKSEAVEAMVQAKLQQPLDLQNGTTGSTMSLGDSTCSKEGGDQTLSKREGSSLSFASSEAAPELSVRNSFDSSPPERRASSSGSSPAEPILRNGDVHRSLEATPVHEATPVGDDVESRASFSEEEPAAKKQSTDKDYLLLAGPPAGDLMAAVDAETAADSEVASAAAEEPEEAGGVTRPAAERRREQSRNFQMDSPSPKSTTVEAKQEPEGIPEAGVPHKLHPYCEQEKKNPGLCKSWLCSGEDTPRSDTIERAITLHEEMVEPPKGLFACW